MCHGAYPRTVCRVGVSGRAMPWHDVKSRTIGQQNSATAKRDDRKSRTRRKQPGRRALRATDESSPPEFETIDPSTCGGCRVVKLPGLSARIFRRIAHTSPYYSYWCIIRKGNSTRRSTRTRRSNFARFHRFIIVVVVVTATTVRFNGVARFYARSGQRERRSWETNSFRYAIFNEAHFNRIFKFICYLFAVFLITKNLKFSSLIILLIYSERLKRDSTDSRFWSWKID